ncbi:tagaturonate epimerase family protein [Paenibacillus sp. IB182496]|uniref:Tagaturonate/fructuronate epimerase n=1 Tax=Paenibacillus sabuli TaxID=2772509 RepID=A0A927BRW4_9BACL|nr:tagaturonate epimerase family protein [Paenibacillus sabuli]MBD2845638.1 tagaturonate epimerase family protein [Paenibacillus sabuli]
MSGIAAIARQLAAEAKAPADSAAVKVYEASYSEHGPTRVVMVRDGIDKKLLAAGGGELYEALQGEEQDGVKRAPLSHENRLVLNRYFDYTVPKAFGKQVATFGLGDRLGLASPGHIQTIRGRDVKPILAQQSIRELALTGRNYREVIDAACYAAFQEGYKDGFGADGDHLKVEDDIRMSLELGFTMLTLDCSEYIDNDIEGLDEAALRAKYAEVPADKRSHYEATYLNRSFEVGSEQVAFDELSLMKNVLTYDPAIGYMLHIYDTFIKTAGREIDFEISIDETMTPTAPESHYLVAKELYDRKLDIFSMAPRFCGEFQKGIDYIGDLAQFERELKVHAAIADHFGYKLSIHSGSDKFSVFELVGKYTGGRFHVKTAGTNWLEAVRTVAKVNPDLYRRMHQYALDHFEEALAYYHVTTDLSKIKPLADVSDAELPNYMNEDNARQLIHITYGILLQAKNEQGGPLFRDEFYRTLIEQEAQYDSSLAAHIGRHLDLLGKRK